MSKTKEIRGFYDGVEVATQDYDIDGAWEMYNLLQPEEWYPYIEVVHSVEGYKDWAEDDKYNEYGFWRTYEFLISEGFDDDDPVIVYFDGLNRESPIKAVKIDDSLRVEDILDAINYSFKKEKLDRYCYTFVDEVDEDEDFYDEEDEDDDLYED